MRFLSTDVYKGITTPACVFIQIHVRSWPSYNCSTSEVGEFLHHRDKISRMSKLNLTEVVWDRIN